VIRAFWLFILVNAFVAGISSSALSCVDEPERSTATLGSGEAACLQERRVNANSGGFVAQDLETYFAAPCWKKQGPVTTLANSLRQAQVPVRTPVGSPTDLAEKNAMVNGVWQQIAFRSHTYLSCRAQTLKLLSTDQKQRDSVTVKARDQFPDVKADIDKLLQARNAAPAKNQANVLSRMDCSGVGGIYCKGVMDAQTQREQNSIDAAIAAVVAQVPFGYEQHVSEAIVEMVKAGRFDDKKFAAAIDQAQQKYENLDSYWTGTKKNNFRDSRIRNDKNGPHFCIDSEFKIHASAGEWSAADQILTEIGPKDRIKGSRLQCYIRGTYRDDVQSAKENNQLVLALGTSVSYGLAIVATDGLAAGGFPAVASLGVNTAIFLDQVKNMADVCLANDIAVTSQSASTCDAQRGLQNELGASEKGSCYKQIGMTLVSGLGLGFELRTFARARFMTGRQASALESPGSLEPPPGGLSMTASRAEEATENLGPEIVVTAPKKRGLRALLPSKSRSAVGEGGVPPATPETVLGNQSLYQRLQTPMQSKVLKATATGKLKVFRVTRNAEGVNGYELLEPKIVPGRYYSAVRLPDGSIAIGEFPNRNGIHSASARAFGYQIRELGNPNGIPGGGLIFYDDGVVVSGFCRNYPSKANMDALVKSLRQMGIPVREKVPGRVKGTNEPLRGDEADANMHF